MSLPEIISTLDHSTITSSSSSNENNDDNYKNSNAGTTTRSTTTSSRSNNGNKESSTDYENDTIKQRHWVLHFDINETILVGDEAGGDTVDDCLNKIIAKCAFVQIPNSGCSTSSTSTSTSKSKPTKDVLPTHWWDGTSISRHDIDDDDDDNNDDKMPPPPLYTGWTWPKSACPYYRTGYKKRAKAMTLPDGDGVIYRPLYQHLKDTISNQFIPSKDNTDEPFLKMTSASSITQIPKSHAFYRMVPSFFHLLVKLQQQNINYTLVLRTFGTDLEDIALALTDFAKGGHPLFPNFYEPKLMLGANNLYKGRWRNNDDGKNDQHGSALDDNDSYKSSVFDLHPWTYDDDDDDIDIDDDDNNSNNDEGTKQTTSQSIVAASGDQQVLNLIESFTVCGIQDDYKHWDKNNNAPWSGKPVWIHTNFKESSNESNRRHCHHLFFDDNIHNDPNDSIVAVREKVNDKWISLSGIQTIEQQGKYLIRVPTVEVLLENDWFFRQIMIASTAS